MPRKMQPTLATGDVAQGFAVTRVTELAEMGAVAYELVHRGTGARVMHFHADDAENLFSVTFPTPPADDTGVPHILEHAVLSGSKRFPVRDPFFEMVKMSMATFINAMTGADATYYPVSSNVRKDLFNLAEVYFDAVFHPLLTEEAFAREGHHLAPADKDRPTGGLTVSGIVYNEMKGAFSNPESRLYRLMTRELFPDTVYGKESGGDPEAIPDLTWAGLTGFHRAFYHPSNALIVCYGDIPTADYLSFLGDKLAVFGKQAAAPASTRQQRWTQPRQVTDQYPIGADEPAKEKTFLMLRWLVGDAIDPQEAALWNILGLILLGHEAAPLKKAIIGSKLGQDLVYSGDSSVGLEMTFCVGLKGSEPDRAGAFEKLVLGTLESIAAAPIERARVEAAFQQAAYHFLEILPLFPLHVAFRVIEPWVYGGDPLAFVRMREHLAQCRRRYESDPQLFNKLIRERLLDNPHRLGCVLAPDKQWQAQTDGRFAQRMQKMRAGLTDADMLKIATAARELEERSGQPNPPEALAKLPQLAVSDLPAKPRQIPTTVEPLSATAELLRNDVFANGVSYLQLNLDLSGLPKELWLWLPRYVEAVQKLGAAGMNYEQIAQRKAAATGGVSCWPVLHSHASDPRRPVWGLHFSTKTLDEQIKPALDVLGDLLLAVDPRDPARLREVLVQTLAGLRSDLVHQGNSTALHHAARGMSVQGHLQETVHGLPQLALCESLVKDFDAGVEQTIARIVAVRQFLLARCRLTASFTGSDRAYAAVRERLIEWSARIAGEPARPAQPQETGFVPFAAPPREGLAAPIQIAHCVTLLPAPHASDPDSALLSVGCRIVAMDHMLPEVRFRGNAYGASCSYDSLGGQVALSSFRDPHVKRTLDVMDGAREFVAKAQWSQTDVDRAIIGAAKHEEKPTRPGEATSTALHRHLIGMTPQLRGERYQAMLSATPDRLKKGLAGALEAGFAHPAVCVVAGREKLEEANRQMPGRELTLQDILT